MAQGVRPAFGKVLTQIQLLQMVVGVACASAFVYLNTTLGKEGGEGMVGGAGGGSGGEACEGSTRMAADGGLLLKFMIGATAVMYGSYFALFALFFARKYGGHTKGKAEGKAE